MNPTFNKKGTNQFASTMQCIMRASIDNRVLELPSRELTKDMWSIRILKRIMHKYVIRTKRCLAPACEAARRGHLPNRLIGMMIAPLSSACQFSSRGSVQQVERDFALGYSTKGPNVGSTHTIVGGSRNSGSETPSFFRTSSSSALTLV